jgi:hypothetical protein
MNNHQVEEGDPTVEEVGKAHVDMLLDSIMPGAGLLFEFLMFDAETGAAVPAALVRLEVVQPMIATDPPQGFKRLKRRR